ncbi:MAG: tetratricopeptide repeat protein [Verrucomicrobia bacterium]|nr:tetratricopeptide repeat protein [Verrucomicrobiota bacterium]
MKYAIPLLTAAWIVALAVATRARNEVWRSEVSLWSDAVAKSPDKYRAWYNLGGAYQRENKIKEVVRCMERAVALEPDKELAWIDLAAGLFVLGRYEESLKTAQLGLQNAGAGRLHYYLGVCHFNLGHIEKSIESLNKVEANDPNYAYSHSTLAMNYTRLRQYDLALHHFRQAAALRPLTPDIQKVFDQVEAYMKHFPKTR